VTRYRFLDGMGDVVAEEEFPDHAAALAAAAAFEDEDVFRVEFLGATGAGPAPSTPELPARPGRRRGQ
jgi:hypothetical protein